MSDASLADDLRGLLEDPNASQQRGPRCTIGKILDAFHDDPNCALLTQAIDSRIVAGRVADLLNKHQERHGQGKVLAQTVRRHRQRLRSSGCSCPRPEQPSDAEA